MIVEVEVRARIYVSIEHGDHETARKVVRDRVCNDWLLRVTEGAMKEAGHYTVKGMSAAVGESYAFGGNPRVMVQPAEDDGIW